MYKLIRQYTVQFSSVLQFAAAIFSGIWVNVMTQTQGSWLVLTNAHLYLAVAFFLWGIQIFVVRNRLLTVESRILENLMHLAVVALARQAGVDPSAVRGFVHFAEKRKPDSKNAKSICLTEVACHAEVSPQDRGPIDTEDDGHRSWFYNVKAYRSMKPTAGNITSPAPQTGGRAPKVKPGLQSVISFPLVWRDRNQAYATITFDSEHSAEDMNWISDGNVTHAAEEIIALARDAIADIYDRKSP